MAAVPDESAISPAILKGRFMLDNLIEALIEDQIKRGINLRKKEEIFATSIEDWPKKWNKRELIEEQKVKENFFE